MFLEATNSLLSGVILPLVLIPVGIYTAVKVKFFYVLHPVLFAKELKKMGGGEGTSPLKALTVALAGTLGVGNISGVATAITAGGAGALFWMVVSALAAMSVKYAEVFLAVKYRRRVASADGETVWHGGAQYYMREGLAPRIGKRAAGGVSAFFAAMLVANSVLTGNVVQVNAAASVFPGVPKIACGAAIALAALAVGAGGAKRIGDFTVRVIPCLTAVYIALSVYVIASNLSRLPAVFSAVVRGAFDLRAAGGGVAGYGILRAVRFGVTRGIFSNEAGCGTAPTAHASANCASAHSQGCLGIFEVFCDTVVMCTMTGLVILLSGVSGCDGIPLSMKAYGAFFGVFGEIAIGVSVVVFALATVVCQEFYGMEALSSLGGGKAARRIYLAVSFAATLAGSVMSVGTVWQIADFEIALMTVTNTLAVFILSDEIKLKEVFM